MNKIGGINPLIMPKNGTILASNQHIFNGLGNSNGDGGTGDV